MSIPDLMSETPIEQVVAGAIFAAVVVGLTYLVMRLQRRPGRIQVNAPTFRYYPPREKGGTTDNV
jgi:hypothetical protein